MILQSATAGARKDKSAAARSKKDVLAGNKSEQERLNGAGPLAAGESGQV